ncbi:unnamed protein product [Rhodiola kirilowii]
MGLTSLRSGSDANKRDQKFDKRVQFYAMVKGTGLAAKKVITKKKKLRSRQKKLKAYDLSSLAEFLPDVSTSKKTPPTDLKLNSKRRNQLVKKENDHLKAFLNNPAFQSDPLGFIHQHLASTQPAVAEKTEKPSKDKKKSKAKKSKKSNPAREAMEI